MRRETLDKLEELRASLEKDAQSIRDSLQGWSASAEVVATKLEKIKDRIKDILEDDRRAGQIAEEAGGFVVVSRNERIDGFDQVVRYRSTNREETQIWTREAMQNMSLREYRRRVDGFPNGG